MKRTMLTIGSSVLACLLVLGTFTLYHVKAQSAAPCLQSEVSLDTGNGIGSSYTTIRRFANVDINTGSDITYTDSASAGASFTINTNGIYSISYTDWRTDTGDGAGITVNANPAASLGAVALANILCEDSPNPSNVHSCSVTTLLASGDVILPQWAGGGFSGSNATSRFVITKVR